MAKALNSQPQTAAKQPARGRLFRLRSKKTVANLNTTNARARRKQKRDKHGRFTKKTAPVWLQRRVIVPVILILIGISGAIYFGLHFKPSKLELANNPLPAPTAAQVVSSTSHKTLPRSEPTHLKIAVIGIDTPLTSVGRNSDHTIEVPVDYRIPGWYRFGPTPGEVGPAIIVGHVDHVGGIAVFWRLRELKVGDIFEVGRADGKTAKFKVDTVKQFARDHFPDKEVYGNINYAGIRLITCGGVFNTQTHEYSHNTVVYGSLVI